MELTKVLTSSLTKHALNYAVAKALGLNVAELDGRPGSLCVGNKHNECIGIISGATTMDVLKYGYYDPSNNWSQGGPIKAQEKICTEYGLDGLCLAYKQDGFGKEELFSQLALTELIACMRCFVESKLGNEVEIPSTLHPW